MRFPSDKSNQPVIDFLHVHCHAVKHLKQIHDIFTQLSTGGHPPAAWPGESLHLLSCIRGTVCWVKSGAGYKCGFFPQSKLSCDSSLWIWNSWGEDVSVAVVERSTTFFHLSSCFQTAKISSETFWKNKQAVMPWNKWSNCWWTCTWLCISLYILSTISYLHPNKAVYPTPETVWPLPAWHLLRYFVLRSYFFQRLVLVGSILVSSWKRERGILGGKPH